MRIAISGPPKWKTVTTRNPVNAQLALSWIADQIQVEQARRIPLEAATSLQLGLDTWSASFCLKQNVPYTVFLACKNQEEFWDVENQEIFEHLASK